MKNTLFLLATLTPLFLQPAYTQTSNTDNLTRALLQDTPIESDLQTLCDHIGGRVTGTRANEQAVEWGLQRFKEAGVKAWTEEVQMPELWLERATTVEVSGGLNFKPLAVSKFYCPVGTYKGGLLDGGTGSEEDFARLGNSAKGAFVLVQTDLCLDISGLFTEYGAASVTEDLARAAGVKGIIFMASRPNKLLYRFVTKRVYDNEMPQIVMAREDAQRCLRVLREGGELDVTVTIDAETGGTYTTHNVIAEIPGSEIPGEIVVIGAHLDSWALGTGANDNGCNVTMMIDIARQMMKLGIQPKRTIRFALWNGEEQGFFGSHAYTVQHADEMDNHVMAMSVDIGSGGIIGFFTNGWDVLIPSWMTFSHTLKANNRSQTSRMRS